MSGNSKETLFLCYPKCTTCQKAKKWLDEHNIPTDSNGDDFGDLVIPVYIGNDTIDEIIVTAQQRRNARSGGMS